MITAEDIQEFKQTLNDLNLLLARDIRDAWNASMTLAPGRQARRQFWQMYPDVVGPHLASAGELTAAWYDSLGTPGTTYHASVPSLPTDEQLRSGAAWALNQGGGKQLGDANDSGAGHRPASNDSGAGHGPASQAGVDSAMARQAVLEAAIAAGATAEDAVAEAMAAQAPRTDAATERALTDAMFNAMLGVGQRQMANHSRNTVRQNALREPGARWVRYASANACAFCRMLATLGTWEGEGYYRSERTALVRRRDGERYHDYCRCIAVPVRPGRTYDEPPWMDAWRQEYKTASTLADSTDRKDLMKAYRALAAAAKQA
ncbi:hypothetical protein [Nocardia terpenica]|uniref:Phage head morphogenesis domain-containing protein n=1 Tax=Nocardia terpenica TaxID=455432 RepID=A0A6G9Z6M5_9NOCA|nr:hypothetical protein [Nocardia terpenica]QIS21265.1 hypothetical protein F6W96_25995 [Nocardia terpenica]